MVFAKENDVGDFTNMFSVVEVCFSVLKEHVDCWRVSVCLANIRLYILI